MRFNECGWGPPGGGSHNCQNELKHREIPPPPSVSAYAVIHTVVSFDIILLSTEGPQTFQHTPNTNNWCYGKYHIV